MNVYVYTRVSAEYQADNTSPDTQRQNCLAWAEKQFGVIVPAHDILEEPGKTGATLDRPRLQELLHRLSDGDVIVVNTMDRLTRDLDNLFELRIKLKSLGVRAFSVVEKLEITTVSLAELPQVVVTGLLSQMELDRIVYRLQSGRRVRMREGEAAFGNTPPFGYRATKRQMPNGHTGTFLEVDEEEADVVRLIFRFLLINDLSSAQIAQRLNAMGIPSPGAWRGKPSRGWYASRVCGILRSSTYQGTYRWGDIEVPVPAVVGPEDHLLAIDKLASNVRFSEKNARYQYMLRGLVRCGICRHTYTGSVVNGHKYYGCEGRKHPKKYNMVERCTAPHLRAGDIEDWVWQTFVGIVDDPARIEVYISRQNVSEAVDLEADLIVLDDRVESLEREQVNLIRMRARGQIENDAALNQALAEVEANLEATRLERGRLYIHRRSDALRRFQLPEIQRRLAALQAAIHGDLPTKLRNELLRVLVNGIVIGAESVKLLIIAPEDELWQRTGCAVSWTESQSPFVVETPLTEIVK